jgi:predicted transcriptional regulator
VEATTAVTAWDFAEMSRDDAVAWFNQASDKELAEVVRTAQRADREGSLQPIGEVPISLMLTSIRLPVDLVQVLDEVAAAEGLNRSEAIRTAVGAYVRERRGGVSPSEAERALDVLRRVVGEHTNAHRPAA